MKAKHVHHESRTQQKRRPRLRTVHLALLMIGAHVSLPLAAAPGKFNPLDPLGYTAKKREAVAGIPNIEIAPGDWGRASLREIRMLLESVAEEFVPLVDSPRVEALSIRVIPRSGSPKVLYEQRHDDEYVVQLTARDDRWYQYAYQFAHELCHVFSNFDHKDRLDEGVSEQNQWFEESLCETASLYTLKRLAQKWETEPPTRNWVGYDQLMSGYVRRLLSESHRYLDARQSFKAWFADNAPALQGDPYLREKNELVATTMLPLFEDNPEFWRSIKYLNPQTASAGKTFAGYVQDWLNASPDKRLPRAVADMFGLSMDAVTGSTAQEGLGASPSVPASETKPSPRTISGPNGE